MCEKADSFAIFSRKFTALDDEGQDRLFKAALRLLEAQKGITSDGASAGKGRRPKKKALREEKETDRKLSISAPSCNS